VGLPLGTPSHSLVGFVNLETGLLQVLHDSLGELLTRVISDVLLQQAAQKVAATGDRKADLERLFCSDQRSPVGECVVKGRRKPVGARCS
jgi:hypothetical protein